MAITYWINPQAKWDWYQIGGRFSHHLPVRAGGDPADLLAGERSWTNENETLDPTYTDAGPVRALDFERGRAAAAEQAGPAWDSTLPWSPVPRSTSVGSGSSSAFRPPKRPRPAPDGPFGRTRWLGSVPTSAWPTSPPTTRWCVAPRSTSTSTSGPAKELDVAAETYRASLEYSIEQARADYGAQPRIAALRDHPAYRGFVFGGPEDIFNHLDRDEYAQKCRDQAIPGWATLTHEGR